MWVFLALTAAVCTALRDAAAKHATRGLDPYLIAFGLAAVPATMLGAIALASRPAAPGPGFVTALLVSGGINAAATPMIIHALQRSDLSLVTPLRSLTPIFMLPVAAIVLAERPSLAGGVGVAVIVAGAYVLNASRRREGVLGPLRALAENPGARLMLGVAFLYSISATFDKVGVRSSSPLVWAAAIQLVTATALAPLALSRWRTVRLRDGRRSAAAVLVAGGLMAAGAVAQMTALTLTMAAYVIAVKRTSTLWSVLLGHSLFREERIRERLLGALVMLAGFALITLA